MQGNLVKFGPSNITNYKKAFFFILKRSPEHLFPLVNITIIWGILILLSVWASDSATKSMIGFCLLELALLISFAFDIHNYANGILRITDRGCLLENVLPTFLNKEFCFAEIDSIRVISTTRAICVLKKPFFRPRFGLLRENPEDLNKILEVFSEKAPAITLIKPGYITFKKRLKILIITWFVFNLINLVCTILSTGRSKFTYWMIIYFLATSSFSMGFGAFIGYLLQRRRIKDFNSGVKK